MPRAGLTLLFLLCTGPLFAQISSSTIEVQGKVPPSAVQAKAASPASDIDQVQLGSSSVELTGPWKFHIGDDMTWAQPDVDDSLWDSMDLTPPAGSADATLGTSGYLPGWTARGYPHHSGFAWYRLKVNVSGATRRLALKMPENVDDAYQVYVNGQKIGEFGSFTAKHVTAYSTLPQAYSLAKGTRDGVITIAIRMWMDSATPFNSPDAGGLHGPPVLGYASIIGALVRLDWDDIAHAIGSPFLEMLILIMALLMSVALFWLDRQEKAYLWLALVCLVTILENSAVLVVNFEPWIGQTAFVILTDVVLTPIRIGLWVLFWAYWFRLWRIGLVHRIVWALAALLAVGTALLRPPLYGQQIPVHYASHVVPVLLGVKLALGVLLFAVALRGFRIQRTEGWMAGIAVLLVAVANYQRELRLIHVPTSFTILDFLISLGSVATILSLLIITVMLLRRFVSAERQKAEWKMEIQQARHVQEVLIPQKLPQIKGLTINSEYRPAREVGGDFFQILPGDVPGSVLIVLGDVTGKGLQAGMLVALIVGAVRGAMAHTVEPAQILTEVNHQLCEREHASATCLMLRIDPDGTVVLANAGQLPPYLNDREVVLEGALPLGIISEAEFSVTSFHMSQGDSLLLMSDGIVEATDPDGNLFGFDRVHEMLRERATPRKIAEAAQAFGQEDDILVLQIRRDTGSRTEVHAEPQLAMQ
jgi:Stage II sporulation protein E (SpoIIE)